MPPPRPQILRITLSHRTTSSPFPPSIARSTIHHSIRPSTLLHPSTTRLPLTRTLASHSAAQEGEHQHHEEGHEEHGHESHYDPPGGWLWGRPPGEKYQKEGWENTMIYGYMGSLALALVLYAYKPDTS